MSRQWSRHVRKSGKWLDNFHNVKGWDFKRFNGGIEDGKVSPAVSCRGNLPGTKKKAFVDGGCPADIVNDPGLFLSCF